eukprot:TRINITY_DN46765_c0_g1_i1.p1 TRINITY_DN46765_c0_g1~~TRINITY_DN46765_c0_g1_i1.p1  ORF type:complete len:355 (+),score=88.79 TRINITY_DN46765_c0_g1_i1:63-1067(+)
MAVLAVTQLGTPPWPCPDPFLLLVYHKDAYPAGNDKMEAPRTGNGQDFNPTAPYRMYHGTRVPGFPRHPHRGFETITCTIDGLVDHADSLGNGGRYGQGDVQWMTAGRGISHSEMFPLLSTDAANSLRFFQIWINLRAKDKMTDPGYTMHWAHEVPSLCPSDGAEVKLWAGRWGEAKAMPPPSASYASTDSSDVAMYFIRLQPGARVTLPTGASGTDRSLYLVEPAQGRMTVADSEVRGRARVQLDATAEVPVSNTGSEPLEVLVLQGKPIGEPVAQHGPFVMNTQQEIREAFRDYQRTEFGRWPYDRDDPVFPREKGRFATKDGKEYVPAAGA